MHLIDRFVHKQNLNPALTCKRLCMIITNYISCLEQFIYIGLSKVNSDFVLQY
jgi:hypothetical protein